MVFQQCPPDVHPVEITGERQQTANEASSFKPDAIATVIKVASAASMSKSENPLQTLLWMESQEKASFLINCLPTLTWKILCLVCGQQVNSQE